MFCTDLKNSSKQVSNMWNCARTNKKTVALLLTALFHFRKPLHPLSDLFSKIWKKFFFCTNEFYRPFLKCKKFAQKKTSFSGWNDDNVQFSFLLYFCWWATSERTLLWKGNLRTHHSSTFTHWPEVQVPRFTALWNNEFPDSRTRFLVARCVLTKIYVIQQKNFYNI